MRYIGLDVHYSTSTHCVLEENGQELQCETVRGHWPKLLERLRTVAGLWTKKGLAWFRQEEWPTPAARLKRDLLLDELTEAKRRARTGTKVLDEIGERHPAGLRSWGLRATRPR